MTPNQDDSLVLQGLIDRIRQGDPHARSQLLEHACHRLRRLTAKILSGSFPVLKARHDLDSVVHETWLRLAQALEKTEPPTVLAFFRLAALKIRQVLLDMVARERQLRSREQLGFAVGSAPGLPPPVQNTYDPARLAMWTELHEKVALLPDEERAVFEMHYYLDLPQAEIARLLDLHPRKVSRLWISATESLTDGLMESGSLL